MAFWQKNTADSGWTSIIFGADRIAVADVARKRDERPQVLAYESFGREGSELDALKRLRDAKRFGKRRCTTLLWHGQYKLMQAELPDNLAADVAHAELCETMRWRVKDMVDFPVDQAGIEVLNIPGTGRDAWVIAASHGVLRPRIHLFQDAHVTLDAIDIPELAQRNIAALLEVPGRGLAFVAFNDKYGRLTITCGGELYMSRHLDVSAPDLVGPDAESMQERILLEIQRSLDSFDRSRGSVPLTRLVVAPMAGGDRLVEYLNNNLSLPAAALNLSELFDLDAAPALRDKAAQAEALLALGAALRD